jgi:hypothetical protein
MCNNLSAWKVQFDPTAVFFVLVPVEKNPRLDRALQLRVSTLNSAQDGSNAVPFFSFFWNEQLLTKQPKVFWDWNSVGSTWLLPAKVDRNQISNQPHNKFIGVGVEERKKKYVVIIFHRIFSAKKSFDRLSYIELGV